MTRLLAIFSWEVEEQQGSPHHVSWTTLDGESDWYHCKPGKLLVRCPKSRFGFLQQLRAFTSLLLACVGTKKCCQSHSFII